MSAGAFAIVMTSKSYDGEGLTSLWRRKVFQEKSHYSLEEAADLLNCKQRDLIHLAVQEKITLLVGVPDNVRFRTYDASAELIEKPALLEPQLLVLRQSHCLQIELNGKTEQCDFQEGYLINPAGKLQKLMPSYGRPRLNHLWAYWRTVDGPFSKKIEILPERLFVVGTDLLKLLASTHNLRDEKAITSDEKRIESEFKSAHSSHQTPLSQFDEIIKETIPHSNELTTQISDTRLTLQELGYRPTQRKNDLDDVIEKAVFETQSIEAIVVFQRLKEYATKKHPPFLGAVAAGLHYESHAVDDEILSLKALRSRLGRRVKTP